MTMEKNKSNDNNNNNNNADDDDVVMMIEVDDAVEGDSTHKSVVMLSFDPNVEGDHNSWTIFGYRWSEIKWRNVLWLIALHVSFVWAYGHAFVSPVKVQSVIWIFLTSMFSGFGMSVGAHRFWAHRTFRATWLVRLFLLVCQTMTINGSAFSYARDHRNHHKWPETHADPKNPGRGFFFAHIGWWMLRKRPEVIEFGRKVPIDDLREDRMLMLQHRFYIPLVLVFGFVFPIAIPIVLWREDPITSIALCLVRIVIVLHHLFSVNSVAHFWGYRPYNRFMNPTENHIINWISMGEGNHNYHHVFPRDYCNSEYLWWEVFNPASLFIDTCVWLRLVAEPRKPSPEMICSVITNKGKPEYFIVLKNRSLTLRIALGLLDWIAGIFVVQWAMWLVIIYKAIFGYPLIHV